MKRTFFSLILHSAHKCAQQRQKTTTTLPQAEALGKRLSPFCPENFSAVVRCFFTSFLYERTRKERGKGGLKDIGVMSESQRCPRALLLKLFYKQHLRAAAGLSLVCSAGKERAPFDTHYFFPASRSLSVN